MSTIALVRRGRSTGSTDHALLQESACSVLVREACPLCLRLSGLVGPQERMDGVESARRGRSAEETLGVWRARGGVF